jgi:TolA-binding protein
VIEEAAEPVQSRVPAVANSTAPRALSVEATSFAGRQRPAAESDKGRDIVPPAMPAAEASELSQQVRDYHAAVASMRANPQLALARLQAYRSKWPQSAIGEEVELRVIEALLALGRQHDAANAAVAFLRRYPRSARAAELRRLAEESSRPGVFED